MNFKSLSLLAAYLVYEANATTCTTDLVNAINRGTDWVNKASAIATAHDTTLQKADVSDKCLVDIFAAVGSKEGDDAKTAEAIQTRLPNVLNYAIEQKAHLSAIDLKYIKHMKHDYIKRFIESGKADQCVNLNENHLKFFLESKSLIPLVDEVCFAVIKGKDKAMDRDLVAKIKPVAFRSVTTPLDDSYFEGMTVDQVRDYQGHKKLKACRCENHFKMHKLDKKTLAAVPRDCFQNWLRNHSTSGTAIDFDKATNLTKDQFYKADQNTLMNLEHLVGQDGNSVSGWTKIKTEVREALLGSPKTAQHVPREAVFSTMSVDAKAFAFMTNETKGAVLAIVKNLPDDLFSHCSDADIEKIDNNKDKSEKNRCTGYKCLKLIEKHSNYATIMSHIDKFVCNGRELKEFAKDEQRYVCGEFMSRDCYKNLNDVDVAQIKSHGEKVHENVIRHLSTDIVKTVWVKENEWIGLAREYAENTKENRLWPGILKNPKVCRDLVTLYTFDKLAKEKLTKAMSGFSTECLRAFKDFKKLSDEYISAIGSHVYEGFTKADTSKVDYTKSSAEQVANISSKVTNIADHFATTLTAETVPKIPVDAWSLMNDSWLRALPADAYAGITKEQWAHIPPHNLNNVTLDQAQMLSLENKKDITPEQIDHIGRQEAKSEGELAMINFLSTISGNFNEAQMKAFKDRQALSSGAITNAAASTMLLAASLALILPLL